MSTMQLCITSNHYYAGVRLTSNINNRNQVKMKTGQKRLGCVVHEYLPADTRINRFYAN